MGGKYETIVVVTPELDEGKVKEESKKIETLLQSVGAKNISLDAWGKKEIAYHVGRHKYGNYLCFRYENSNGPGIDSLTHTLRITDSVIKFQTHRIEDRVRKFKGNPRRMNATDLGDDYGDLGDTDY